MDKLGQARTYLVEDTYFWFNQSIQVAVNGIKGFVKR